MQKNFQIARSPLFAKIIINQIERSGIIALKIHASGDFFSPTYIDDWTTIVTSCPAVKFWAYTRSWVRPDFRPSLARLAALQNMRLVLSFDRSMPIPPAIPTTDRCYLSVDGSDAPPVKCLVVWRASLERRFVPLTVMNRSLVCPHQNGNAGPDDCITCKVCLP